MTRPVDDAESPAPDDLLQSIAAAEGPTDEWIPIQDCLLGCRRQFGRRPSIAQISRDGPESSATGDRGVLPGAGVIADARGPPPALDQRRSPDPPVPMGAAMGGGRGRQDRSGEAVEGAARPLGSARGGGRRWATTTRSAPGGGGRWAGGSGIGVEGMIHAASAPLTPAGCGFEGLLADRQVRRGPILTASATRGGPRPVFVPGGAQPQVASGGAGCGGRPSRSPSRGGGAGRRRPPPRAPAG